MDGTLNLRLQRLQIVGTELLGANSEPKLSKILGAYGAPDRHYHNLEHLDEVLLLWKRLAPPDPILGLALLYHDVVYKSRANDNERQSADWACRDLSPLCSEVELVEQLILDTRHQAPDHLGGLDRRSLLGAGSWTSIWLSWGRVRRALTATAWMFAKNIGGYPESSTDKSAVKC